MKTEQIEVFNFLSGKKETVSLGDYELISYGRHSTACGDYNLVSEYPSISFEGYNHLIVIRVLEQHQYTVGESTYMDSEREYYFPKEVLKKLLEEKGGEK